MWRQPEFLHFHNLGCFKNNNEKAMLHTIILLHFLYFDILNTGLCLVNTFCGPNWNQIRLFHGAHEQKNVMWRG